jgi:accessory colonization factor AcfC
MKRLCTYSQRTDRGRRDIRKEVEQIVSGNGAGDSRQELTSFVIDIIKHSKESETVEKLKAVLKEPHICKVFQRNIVTKGLSVAQKDQHKRALVIIEKEINFEL